MDACGTAGDFAALERWAALLQATARRHLNEAPVQAELARGMQVAMVHYGEAYEAALGSGAASGREWWSRTTQSTTALSTAGSSGVP